MRPTARTTAATALLVASLVAGCAAPAVRPATVAETADAAPSTRAAPSPIDASAPEANLDVPSRSVPEDLIGRILADAADRSGVDRASLEVVRADAVTWNDGSLGCPEPGQLYTQALVDGYHVVVDAGGERLDYRVGQDGRFRLCERPGPLPSGGSADS